MARLRSCIRMLAPYRPAAETLVFCPDRCMLFSVLASLCIPHMPVMHQKLCTCSQKAHLHYHDLELTGTHHRHRGRFLSDERRYTAGYDAGRLLGACQADRRRRAHQSSPSYSPSPRMATADCTCHFRPFSCDMPRASQTSDADSAPLCMHSFTSAMHTLAHFLQNR